MSHLEPTPYRSAASPENEPASSNALDESGRLGPLLSTHLAPSLARSLSPALVVAPLLLIPYTLAPGLGTGVFAIVAPFVVAVVLLVAWPVFRSRGVRVDLHRDGLVFSTPKMRTPVVFDDVDEVWLLLDAMRSPLGSVALVRAVRLVNRDKTSHFVPTNLRSGHEIVKRVIRYCSYPLQTQAIQALRAGETLTFGDIQLDRDGIRGPSWAARWDELSLVRYAPGRVNLFRKQKVFPWRSIDLERVPHPTVFGKAVTECARKVDIDDPLGALAK